MSSKSVLITGCSLGGIGDGLAREFHSRGLTVFATARSPAKMAHLKALGINTIELDVTSTDSIVRAVEVVRQATEARGLDILINNAGVNITLPVMDCSMDEIKAVLDTNVIGVFAVTKAFLPLLIQAKGMVVNIGSVNEIVNPAYMAPYNASKGALLGFSHTLRVELRPFGVKVVHIRTGGVSTNINNGEGDRMPADSLYAPLRASIEGRAMLHPETYTTPEQYAKQVADDLLGSPGPMLWRGRFSTWVWLLSCFAWTGALVSLVRHGGWLPYFFFFFFAFFFFFFHVYTTDDCSTLG